MQNYDREEDREEKEYLSIRFETVWFLRKTFSRNFSWLNGKKKLFRIKNLIVDNLARKLKLHDTTMNDIDANCSFSSLLNYSCEFFKNDLKKNIRLNYNNLEEAWIFIAWK